MTETTRSRRRVGRYKQVGIARELTPVKEVRHGKPTGRWKARYIDVDGRRRQEGIYDTKDQARRAIQRKVAERNNRGSDASQITLAQWNETWPNLIGLQPRSRRTHEYRMGHYVLPHLPPRLALGQINRGIVLGVQDALLALGLSKRTINGALASFSAVLGYAVDRQLLDYNPALGVRVREQDQRLRPKRAHKPRRYIPPDELAAFLIDVPANRRAVCSAPVLTGLRTQELFAARGEEIRYDEHLIWVYQRAPTCGGRGTDDLIAGTKTTKGAHNKPKDQLGRFTLFPQELIDMLAPSGTRPIGLLFSSPTGLVWAQRNFYRDVWHRAQPPSATSFTLYDLRHTWVSLLSAAGIPDAEVSLYAGHAVHSEGSVDNTTTRVYRHATGRWLQPALEAISGYWGKVVKAETDIRARTSEQGSDVPRARTSAQAR